MTQPPSNPPAGQETGLHYAQNVDGGFQLTTAEFVADLQALADALPEDHDGLPCLLHAMDRLEANETELAAAKAQLAEAQHQRDVWRVEVKTQLAAARQDMKEECAKVCAFDYYDSMECRKALLKRAAAIRALKP